MKYQFISIIALLAVGSLVTSNSSINSAFGLPQVKVMVPSICEKHPGICKIKSIIDFGCPPFCIDVPIFSKIPHGPTDPVPWSTWSAIIQNLTQSESLIVIPFNGSALAIKVPTQDIEISGNLSNASQQ